MNRVTKHVMTIVVELDIDESFEAWSDEERHRLAVDIVTRPESFFRDWDMEGVEYSTHVADGL